MKRLRLHVTLLGCLAVLTVLTGCPPGALRAGATRTFDGIQFKWCPPGTFAMGSPMNEEGRYSDEDLHEVTLTEGFWISTREITQAQWKAVMGDEPASFPGSNRPVETVSWNDVQDFLVLLNASARGGTYSLPTEAQWEYAYRAGTTTRFYWGKDANETKIGDFAWYLGNSSDKTHPVGRKGANAWGLEDMSGNVAEWCNDYVAAYPMGPVTDPEGPVMGTHRSVRGGSCFEEPGECRAAYRNNGLPTSQYDFVGFRLVRKPD